MPAQESQTTWTAYLSDTVGTVSAGSVLCLNAAGTRYVVSTTANRALQTLGSVGIANTAGDDDNRAVELQFCGLIPNAITGLGAGAAVPVRTSATGVLERVASPVFSDEVVGKCDTAGNALVNFATQSELLTTGQPPSLPARSLQYELSGAFGGSTDVLISNDAAENLTIGNALGTPVATVGTIRAASGGVDHATGFEFYVRNGGNTGNLLAVGVYNATLSGTPRDVLTLGGFGGATRAPYLFTQYAQNTIVVALTTATPQSSKTGYTLYDIDTAGPIGSWSHRRLFGLQRHTNFALFGSIDAITSANIESYLGTGEGIAYFGRAEYLSSTNPATGIIAEVDANDRWQYRRPGGFMVPLWDGPQKVTSTSGTLADISTLDPAGLPVRIHEFTAASTTTLGSLSDGREGRSVFIVSNPGEASFTVKHNSGGTATNRVLTPSGFDQQYDANEVVPVIYDTSATRWRVVGRNPWKLGGAGHDVTITGASVSVTAEVGESFSVQVNGQRPLLADENFVYLGKPISGDDGLGVPLRIRSATITFASANYTMAGDTEACAVFLTLAGTTGGARDLIAPNDAGSVFNVKNGTGDIITLKKSAGTGVAIAAGAKGWFFHNGTDYEAR